MSPPSVGQVCLAFLRSLPIVVQARDVQVSGDAGILPIRQFDHQIGYTERFIA